MFRVYFVSETAQVELKSGRVEAPATRSCSCTTALCTANTTEGASISGPADAGTAYRASAPVPGFSGSEPGIARLHTSLLCSMYVPVMATSAAAVSRSVRPGRRMRRVCMGTLVHSEQTVRERVARPGRERVARPVHRYTTSKQSGMEWPGPGPAAGP